ncbi:MAG TPA: 1,4-alpha-glucan branching protein GlgB, partial [Cyclobacteriaceae bacterium]
IKDLGFTHVEFLPIMEHPFFGSWGYQVTGYFAPSSRFGTPADFKFLVDALHQADIGVILDWVPSHFPGDAHGLFKFDGTYLYEHEDPRKGFHPDWKSYIFNYGRDEVRSVLISNAIYWLDQYHIDGLRVDAVASMLYLDYSRKEGEWIPNEYGGRENIESIVFLKEFNETAYGEFPDVITIAEESTAWPGVSRPTYLGGLGFGQKWMMGWMHDTLRYFGNDPVHRKYHQNDITFSVMYAFTENFMLPLSHDEVVHGKGSLMGRMPGDEWRRFANLRLLYSYMFTHPGTKLLFMGGEFGQTSEWNHDQSLDWHLLDHHYHKGVYSLMKDLNALYKNEEALYFYSFSEKGFAWVDYADHQNSVIIYKRMSDKKEEALIVICNFTPEKRANYRVGVPYRGEWKEIFNSDDMKYGGSGVLNQGLFFTSPVKYHGSDYSVSITLPPLGISILKLERELAEFELNQG